MVLRDCTCYTIKPTTISVIGTALPNLQNRTVKPKEGKTMTQVTQPLDWAWSEPVAQITEQVKNQKLHSCAYITQSINKYNISKRTSAV